MTAVDNAWTIERVDWHDERAVVLRAAMDEDIGPRYADAFAAFDGETRAVLAEDFAVDPATIVDVILVHDASGDPVGHAALRALGDELEVKRVFVKRRARGQGASRALMAELERVGADRGATRLILQTGDRQPEAIALYERIGYHRIDTFAPYVRFPASRCFAKPLVVTSSIATSSVASPTAAEPALAEPLPAVPALAEPLPAEPALAAPMPAEPSAAELQPAEPSAATPSAPAPV